MSHHGNIAHMIEAHPSKGGASNDKLQSLLESLHECAAVCTGCADACLAEEMVADMRGCIRTDLDCADICAATARVAGRQTKPDAQILRAMVQACQTACQRCGSECDQHASKMEHCKICAEVCHRCEEACRSFLGA